ncbi:hypothetical protein BY458DRAFT_496488 [Sporodiniella umbellata]|nr:hypothetical protein BY458DRAFT_496488 [Sporodiniella umbellata]
MNTEVAEALKRNNKMQTRRSSRSFFVVSPTEPEKDIHGRLSQSIELTKCEVADSKKRKDVNKTAIKADNQKERKEAKWTKRLQRDALASEELRKLDKVEEEVKKGSHTNYRTLLSRIEEKRSNKLKEASVKREMSRKVAYNFFVAQKESAISQYHWEKIALRRSMIKNIQYKLNRLEREYYDNHSNDIQKENFSDWNPPERPSVISPLTQSLTSDESDKDLALASKKNTLPRL